MNGDVVAEAAALTAAAGAPAQGLGFAKRGNPGNPASSSNPPKMSKLESALDKLGAQKRKVRMKFDLCLLLY